jgi:hypothetical protein
MDGIFLCADAVGKQEKLTLEPNITELILSVISNRPKGGECA